MPLGIDRVLHPIVSVINEALLLINFHEVHVALPPLLYMSSSCAALKAYCKSLAEDTFQKGVPLIRRNSLHQIDSKSLSWKQVYNEPLLLSKFCHCV